MYNFIFSIPIHEHFEVVLDQVINIKHYNPNCAIVFHISQVFDYKNSLMTREEFDSCIQKIGDVYVNPQSLRTGFADIIQAHISNFEYVKTVADFHFFAMMSSNELFVREGLFEKVKTYDCGANVDPLNPKATAKTPQAIADNILTKIVSQFPNGEKRGSQIEGTFYRKELFATICRVITEAYDYREMKLAYPREEIYFSTVLYCLMQQDSTVKRLDDCKFTLMQWNHALRVFISDVRRIRNSNTNFYSLKRIDRTLDDFVRKYIMITGGYYHLEHSYNPKLRKNIVKALIKYIKELFPYYNTRIRILAHNLFER